VADERVIANHGKMLGNSIATARDPLLLNWKKHLFSQQCAVARVYPLQAESSGISLFAIGGEAKVVSMDVWQMRSMWPELKYREEEWFLA